MAYHGKKYRASQEKIQEGKRYTLAEAVALAKQTATTSFDSTVEIHITTGANVKHADQIVRSTITLPAGTGKSKKIGAFCSADHIEAAKAAGADIAGGDELIETVKGGTIDFEVAVATPDMMKSLAKIARILGPKGLMPSPKAGTVTPNIADTITQIKKGKMEFRTDKQGIIHSILGKASFSEADLLANTKAFCKSVMDNKPSGIKGTYLKTITLTTSMGPAIPVDVAEASA